MSRASHVFADYTLELEQHEEKVESLVGERVIDPAWQYRDSAGHDHTATSVHAHWVETPGYYCEDCRDEHAFADLVCDSCDEVIEPRYVWTEPRTVYVPTPQTWWLRTNDGSAVWRLRPDELPGRIINAYVAPELDPEWLARVTGRQPDEATLTFIVR